VAERARAIQGYASSRAFRERAAYDRSVETSIYLAPDAVGHGLGSRLYGQLLETLEAESRVHRAYGGVALPNEASVALHLRLGFKQVASFSEVGFKFGRFWDVVWFERAL
jgi:phosphinothricin acetyltransferase